jgi:hypothetical protein
MMFSHSVPTVTGGKPHPWQARFEDQRVALVLKHFGLERRAQAIREDHALRWGPPPRLTFEGLGRACPAFPVALEARVVARVAERCRPADLFRAFEKNFLFDYYLEAYSRQSDPDDGWPVGLVLPFDGYPGGLVLHNADFASGPTRLVHDLPAGIPPFRVTAEPFGPFVKCLARSGWSSRVSIPVQASREPPAMLVERWMVERLGTGPAVCVLAWLHGVLNGPAGPAQRFVGRDRVGNRYVAASYADIVEATGLSAGSVKRALATLREFRLVGSARRASGCLYRLIAPEPEAAGG